MFTNVKMNKVQDAKLAIKWQWVLFSEGLFEVQTWWPFQRVILVKRISTTTLLALTLKAHFIWYGLHITKSASQHRQGAGEAAEGKPKS